MNRRTSAIAWLALIAAFGPVGAAETKPADRPHNDAKSTYEILDVEGWKVLVSARYAGHDEEKAQVLDEVRAQLRRVTMLINDGPLTELRKVEIWVEYDYPGRSQYHPSEKWLVDNGYVAEKARTVEIAGAREFLDWRARPVMTLLHELAHAYHDRVLGFGDPRILELYSKARKSGKFDKVVRDHGRTDRHYGLTTHQEYFAEASEAYLWVNDYYPFVYGELREADPEMAQLLEAIWGKRR